MATAARSARPRHAQEHLERKRREERAGGEEVNGRAAASGRPGGPGFLAARELRDEDAADADDEPGHEPLNEEPAPDHPRVRSASAGEERRGGGERRAHRPGGERRRDPDEHGRDATGGRRPHSPHREGEHRERQAEPQDVRQLPRVAPGARDGRGGQRDRGRHLPCRRGPGPRPPRHEREQESDHEAGEEAEDLGDGVEEREGPSARAAQRERQHGRDRERGALRKEDPVRLPAPAWRGWRGPGRHGVKSWRIAAVGRILPRRALRAHPRPVAQTAKWRAGGAKTPRAPGRTIGADRR